VTLHQTAANNIQYGGQANPTLANFSGETANGFGTNSIATNYGVKRSN
jgi:hypothetical protein